MLIVEMLTVKKADLHEGKVDFGIGMICWQRSQVNKAGIWEKCFVYEREERAWFRRITLWINVLSS